ncbi:hypothetical protein [uncultured Desulfobacter sp.]|jgi:hypothetical protein|uniref:hypothetical protein n=1 Tax=uncultured Desulfobacter sp. TaxID=240139 RepID=UPI0029C86D09|nr:hypothetical protein [uncultured Desulfobacter sp.]
MFTPDQFEVNEVWIVIRINEDFLFVKEDPYDMFVLMDAASAYVLGFVFSKVVAEAPTVKDVEELFNKAWGAKRQWAKKLIVTDESVASNVFIQEAEKNGIPFVIVPISDLSSIVEPLKESFEKDFIGKRT